MKTKLAAAVLMSALVAGAGPAQAHGLDVKEPWVRATVPQQSATGAFMTITAPHDVKIVEARSPVAATVEIHEMAMQGDTMQMRAVVALALPAGKAVELKPGGYHVMLMGLKQQIKPGDTVPISLVIEGAGGKRETIEIKAPVRALGGDAKK